MFSIKVSIEYWYLQLTHFRNPRKLCFFTLSNLVIRVTDPSSWPNAKYAFGTSESIKQMPMKVKRKVSGAGATFLLAADS